MISPSTLSFVVPASLSLGTHSLAVAQKAGPWPLSSPVTFTVVAASAGGSSGGDAAGRAYLVIFPKGGESLVAGSTATLKWTPLKPGGTVALILLYGPTNIIFAQIPDTGSYDWSIPSNYVNTGYKLKVQSIQDPSLSAVAAGTFSVVSSQTASALNALGALLQQLIDIFKK
jgi:hypothetical protein